MLSCLVSGQSIHAADPATSPLVRTAAFTADQTRPSERQVRGEQRDQVDRLLAQSMPPNTAEGSGETILVGFLLSTPESDEEDVTKQYGLELVKRSTDESPNRRIVVFRVPDARAVADVLAALNADPRVISAQINVRYGLPEQPPSGPEISELKEDPPVKGEKRQASRPGRKIAPPAKAEARAAERLNTAQATRAAGPIPPMKMSSQQGSLAARNHAALRWPTADEPFVNVGMTNK
jgi:hypothetical protein